ncbi:2-aminoethylphosphonate ABC transporter permease subunit [Labrys wisconsinensis]|uniref:2-aminoethylphosphonate transport system permease protein n=1 Tax=Labrys wisconsinensis TaxID=425677 RepID=A0ABU0JIY2_9HYPH|nr:2-aminoethylphosphonate ABC transporter permease subunit [Labrys wisconsinensis]MDQ0473368.1 2-aminoethylphosphonate transport system permease protein [Labrys wisconsinensis]
MPADSAAVAAPPAAANAAAAWRHAWLGPPLLALAAIFLYPLALIARQAFTEEGEGTSLQPLLSVVRSGFFTQAVLNTLEIAIAATAGCLALGFVFALVLSFVPFPGSRVVSRLIDSVIALPTFLVALAFTFLYGSSGLLNGLVMSGLHLSTPPVNFLYSAWGVILAEVTVYTPFAMRPLIAAFSLLDRAQIEVASSLGARPARIVRQIILPAALPALLAGGSLCLLLTVNEFGIVLFIGAKGVVTLPLLIYDKAIQESDYSAACVIALINVGLSILLFALYRTVVNRLGGRHAGVV